MPSNFNGQAFNVNSKVSKKCTLYNNKTKKTLTAQFVPTSVSYGRNVTFSESVSPGMNYPLTVYNHGEAIEFDIELFFYDKPYTGRITAARRFLKNLMPPEINQKPRDNSMGSMAQQYVPPTFRFIYGYMRKTLVLKGLSTRDEWLDKNGRPIMCTFVLSVRQV